MHRDIKKKTRQWDFENIFTEPEAGSVSANIGFCWGANGSAVTLDSGKTMTKWDQRRKKYEKWKKAISQTSEELIKKTYSHKNTIQL